MRTSRSRRGSSLSGARAVNTLPSTARSSCAVVPTSMSFPSFMTAFSAAMYSTSETMCVEMSTMRPRANSLSRLRKRTRSPGSRPLVGSSSMSTSGSFSSAWAIPTRRWVPPDSFLILLLYTRVSESVSHSSPIRSRASRFSMPFSAAM